MLGSGLARQLSYMWGGVLMRLTRASKWLVDGDRCSVKPDHFYDFGPRSTVLIIF